MHFWHVLRRHFNIYLYSWSLLTLHGCFEILNYFHIPVEQSFLTFFMYSHIEKMIFNMSGWLVDLLMFLVSNDWSREHALSAFLLCLLPYLASQCSEGQCLGTPVTHLWMYVHVTFVRKQTKMSVLRNYICTKHTHFWGK